MALSTISPALALLGIKGIGEEVTFCSEAAFRVACVVAGAVLGVLLPWLLLTWLGTNGIQKTLENMTVTEGGDHMIVYSVAVILPLWAGDTGSNAELLATGCAFALVWLLIASSNLHHANLYLRLRGYRFFTADPPEGHSRSLSDSFLILSHSDITGRGMKLFCSVLDGKLLVLRETQPESTGEDHLA